MKKIFISTPFPIIKNSEQLQDIQSHVKEELNIDIKIVPYEWEEDNQTGTFEVEDEQADDVICILHEFGDVQCFYAEPNMIYDEQGRTMGWSNAID